MHSPFLFRSFVPLFCLVLSLLSCQEQKGEQVKLIREQVDLMHFHLPPLPEQMELFGEKIDLTDLDTRERLDRELHSIVFYHSQIFLYFKRAHRFFPEIEGLLQAEKVPDDFKYLALVESGLAQATSSKGAQGFWQFMEKTGKEYGMEINKEVDERRNLELSTKGAASYLREAKELLGTWILAAASYNRGMAGLEGDLEKQEVENFFDSKLNSETSRYVFRIMAMKLIFENALDYGFDSSKMELYPPYQVKTVHQQDIEDIYTWSIEAGFNYKIVMLLNPWIKGKKLTKREKGYDLQLPANGQQLKVNL